MLLNLQMVLPKNILLEIIILFFFYSYLFTIFLNWMRSIMSFCMITRKKTCLTKIIIKTSKTSITISNKLNQFSYKFILYYRMPITGYALHVLH
jgi:hypothetical protein